MVAGRGPRVAPSSESVPAYCAAPIGKHVTIKAYVGVPLARADGSLFGTLCAIDPVPQPQAITQEQPLIELLAGILSGLLNSELKAVENNRRAERAEAESEIDSLTDVHNRRGWDRLLAAEETRCRRYGHPACVIAVDLDGLKAVNDSHGHIAGDQLLRRTGQAIRAAVRESGVVSRVGGDEFAVLGIECDEFNSRRLLQRIRTKLMEAEVAASLGLVMRVPCQGLQAAWQAADQEMYREKASRNGSTPRGAPVYR